MPTILKESRYGSAYSAVRCSYIGAQMQHERREGIASAHRDDSVEENLKHFAEMKTGSTEGLRWCVRAKMSVDDPNKALRDPVIYRCNPQPHHRTG